MTNKALDWWGLEVRKIKKANILELGTRRWGANSTHHKEWFSRLKVDVDKYVMSDFMEGADVDVLADCHSLSKTFGEGSFDTVIACSVWEHLDFPWIAAEEVWKVLKPGGIFFVQTHFIFEQHGYPNDTFRYTTRGLENLFKKMSFVVSDFEFPCRILADNPKGTCQINAWINSCIAGRK